PASPGSGSARSSRRRSRSSATPAGRRSSATTWSSERPRSSDPDLLRRRRVVVTVAEAVLDTGTDLRHASLHGVDALAPSLAGQFLAAVGRVLHLRAADDGSPPPCDLRATLSPR